MSLQKRIQDTMKRNGLKMKDLCASVGITDAGMRKIYARNSCEVDLLYKIAEFLQVPTYQLLEDSTYIESGNSGLKPHYLSLAKAGLQTEEVGIDYELQPTILQMPKYDYTVEVRGDSMEPEYKSGDIIACLDVTKSAFLQWGRVHVLNTSQGVVLKKIYEDGDNVRCVSSNGEKYPDYSIPKIDIYSIGLVVGALKIS